MEENYLVVLHNSADGGKETIYPEVHHVFSDDAFSPAVDLLEQQSGDISILIDLDESGENVVSAQSISPGWQVLETAVSSQSLAGDHQSRLISIMGTKARQLADIPDLNGSFDEQVARSSKIIEQLQRRNAELRRIIQDSPFTST